MLQSQVTLLDLYNRYIHLSSALGELAQLVESDESSPGASLIRYLVRDSDDITKLMLAFMKENKQSLNMSDTI